MLAAACLSVGDRAGVSESVDLFSVDQVYGGPDRPPPQPLSGFGFGAAMASSSLTHKTQFHTPVLQVTPAVNRRLSVTPLQGGPHGLMTSPVSGTLLGIPESPATSTRFGFASSLLPSTSEPLPKRQFLFPPPPLGWQYSVQVVMADAAEGGPNAVSEEQCGPNILCPAGSERHSGNAGAASLDTEDGQGSGSVISTPLRLDCSVHLQRAVTRVILRLPIVHIHNSYTFLFVCAVTVESVTDTMSAEQKKIQKSQSFRDGQRMD